MRKPRLYVCGRYRAATEAEVSANIAEAQEIGSRINLLKLSWSIVPHSLSAGMETSLPDDEWIDLTMGELETCHAVYVMIGADSDGCKGEIKRAEELGIPIHYAHEDLLVFLLTLLPVSEAR